MPNPFDAEDGSFHVLVNDRGEHSLWPDFAPDPAGWRRVCTSVSRTEAMAYVEEHWTALAPGALGGAPSRPAEPLAGAGTTG